MPSPFPGMDPYLEGHLWTGFHHELAVAVKYQLAPQLSPRYFAFTERYLLTDTGEDEVGISARAIYPDVGIARSRAPAPFASKENGRAATVAPVEMLTAMPLRVPHYRLAIRDVKNRKLVTIMEFLSPVNKRGQGRRKYLRKRNKILSSSTHLLEIDLLRRGTRVPMKQEYPEGSYFVIVSRARKRPRSEVWPVRMDQALPIVPVPLLKTDRDIMLDLQQAFTSVYDQGYFKNEIDYRRAPDVPLTGDDDAWADDLLHSRGLR